MNSPNFSFEKRLWKKGFKLVGGIDEVGRGSFSGPLMAALVVFPKEISIPKNIEINDSKKLSSKKRELAASWIKKNSIVWATGSVSAKVIDRVGMTKATHSVFRRALLNAQERLDKRVDFLLIDAFYVPYTRGFPVNGKNAKQRAIVNGDSKSLSIAAASIIAKTTRDKLMISLSLKPRYKRYQWESNKGYGTKSHRQAIKKYGLTSYHRRSFINL